MATIPSSSSPRNRPPRRPVVVRSVEGLTPKLVRVTVAGELADWPEPGAAAHLKIFLPQSEGDAVMRTYTVRSFDRGRREVAIDFYLHEGNGPAARWAASARPGDELELSGRARSTFEPDDATTSYLFAGDASALPAIATCLESLPGSARAAVIAATGEEIPLESRGTLDVRWLCDASSEDFVAAVAEVEAERAWVACEAAVMRRIRSTLRDEGRYTRDTLSTHGYWKRGEANHPDHDTGEDDG